MISHFKKKKHNWTLIPRGNFITKSSADHQKSKDVVQGHRAMVFPALFKFNFSLTISAKANNGCTIKEAIQMTML